MDHLDDRLLAALDRVVVAAVGVTTVALAGGSRERDLTLPQWRALMVISSSGGVRAGDVAKRIGMSRPSMSRLVRRLERHGMVVASQDPVDRRATILQASRKGNAVRVATLDRRQKLVEDALAGRSPLPRDLLDGLHEIADALSRYG